jgi:cytochrome P450
MATRMEDVPAELVVDFDVFDESIVDTVHERLAEMQRNTPLAYCPASGGYWIVTTYDDVYEVMRNDEIYSAAETGLLTGPKPSRLPPVHFDPPEHTAYRTMMNPIFSPARMRAVEADIRTTASDLLDGFAGTGSCEFVTDFAHPLPTMTFLSLMGWPKSDLPLFAGWTQDLLVGRLGATEDEIVADRSVVQTQVRAYFRAMVEERRRDPDVDDVTGHLLRALYDGERPLTDEELIPMLSLLMVAGLHTVSGILSFGMIYLDENPAERQRMIDDPSLIPDAVEEILRMGVGTAPARLVVEPVTLHGVELQPGDKVVGFLSAANRDPDVFECPHAMQVDRQHNRHLTFAAGRHRCLGSNLARVELGVALEEILRRIPYFRIDPERPPMLHHGQIRGVRQLHLTFSPERG